MKIFDDGNNLILKELNGRMFNIIIGSSGESIPDQDSVLEIIKDHYSYKRKYLPIEEQLDMLYWDKKNGTNNWEEHIDQVKLDNPSN